MFELPAGAKQSHWMWFILPQIKRPGVSPTARKVAIRSREEAAACVRHPVRGPRLKEAVTAVIGREQGHNAWDILGHPDAVKFRSSMTRFAAVSEPGSVFHPAPERYFGSDPDPKTLSPIP